MTDEEFMDEARTVNSEYEAAERDLIAAKARMDKAKSAQELFNKRFLAYLRGEL